MLSSDSHLLEIFHKISGFILAVTFIFNYVLIYLTVFHAPNLFGTYRHFIVTFAVFGILFSTLEYFLKPILYLNNYSVIIFSLDFSVSESSILATVLLAFFVGFHCAMLSLISVQFLYRYWSITSSVFLFESSRFAYWILSVVFGGFIWTVFTYEVISCDFFERNRLSHELENHYQFDFHHVNCIQLEVKRSESSFRWSGVGYLVVFTFVLLIKLFVMLFCGLKMACQVYKRSNFRSSRHHRQHYLFFKSVFVQILAPVFILYLPTFGLSYLPFMTSTYEIIVPIFTVYPVIDSIIVMNVISDYKIAIQKAISRLIRLFISEDKQMETQISMNNLFTVI